MRPIFTTVSREDSTSRRDGLETPTDTMSDRQKPMIYEHDRCGKHC